jgi:hypothetical protein
MENACRTAFWQGISTKRDQNELQFFPEKSAMNRNLAFMLPFLCILFSASLMAQQQTPPASPDQSAGQPPSQAMPEPSTAPAYTPKFKGDPARSDSEAGALAYMRVVIRAQKLFKKQYDHYATSLAELVHSGTFTKRMLNPERGDYTVGFKGKRDSYVLTMTPKNMDAQHRSFYAEEDGKIHGDETKPADADSPVITRAVIEA